MYSAPLDMEALKAEAERMQRRFEVTQTAEEFARISEEVSRRIAILAPVADILQRYLIIAELAHREYEALSRKQAPPDE